MKWQPISTAPKDRPILLKYRKGSKGMRGHGQAGEFVTQGYWDEEKYYTPNGYQPTGSGKGEWMDYTNRLLQGRSDKSKNEVLFWMELP
jgi:hypothetical protein